jgi:outer membrane receptor protein involved in Fe transport
LCLLEPEAAASIRRRRKFGRLALVCLLAGAAIPARATNASEASNADAATEGQSEPDSEVQEVVVNGQSLFHDVQPERIFDERGIASYGVSTVDDLVAEIQTELGEDEEPLILVNGERINDLSEIGGLPVEALKNVQVLPRGSAVRAGGTTGQRVISLTLVRKARSLTATAAPKFATERNWSALSGEGILTKIRGSTRANLTLRVRNESSLLESDRGIIQPAAAIPYALTGNVIAYPSLSGEIDPILTDAAGEIVTVVPIPSTGNPTLEDFAAKANDSAVTDLGRYRTLRPQTHNYDLNGSFSTRLAPWLTSNAALHLNSNVSRSLRGLPTALFRLTENNPASPFSTDVNLAYFLKDPLRSRSRMDNGEARLTLNGRFGKWTGNFNLRHSVSKSSFDTGVQTTFGSIALDDDVNPFMSDLSHLVQIRTARADTRSISDLAELSFTGPATHLPAGDLQATIEGRLAWDRLRSQSTFSTIPTNTQFHRDEQTLRGAVEIPLASRENGFLRQLGELTASAEFTKEHFSDAGTIDEHAIGLTWEPIEPLRLRGSIERTEMPPAVQMLGSPEILTPDVRVFDPLTEQTVDVIEISGGNPSLPPQKTDIRRISGLLRLVPRLNLQLNAEYTETDQQNFISSLPAASAAVMLAFPDRFIRDSAGVLTTIDFRPVSFDSHREKRLRWGFSLNSRVGGGGGLAAGHVNASSVRAGQFSPPTMLELNANHTIVFSDRILIRSGLDPIDLLSGGAIGIGGGRVRHQIDATAALTSGGVGVRTGITWRGASTLEARTGTTIDMLRFSPVMSINLRAFADARRILPQSQWTKGLRLSLEISNLTNDRQSVRDSFGNTPLQYQPGYRDPIGRTIEFEIRKVF